MIPEFGLPNLKTTNIQKHKFNDKIGNSEFPCWALERADIIVVAINIIPTCNFMLNKLLILPEQ